MRSTQQVLDDHLQCRIDSDIEGDIERNYAPDVVILTSVGQFKGHDNVRKLNGLLHDTIQTSNYEFPIKLIDGPYAFIEWRAREESKSVEDGTDSFVIEDGKIKLQTIHYMIEETMPYPAAGSDE